MSLEGSQVHVSPDIAHNRQNNTRRQSGGDTMGPHAYFTLLSSAHLPRRCPAERNHTPVVSLDDSLRLPRKIIHPDKLVHAPSHQPALGTLRNDSWRKSGEGYYPMVMIRKRICNRPTDRQRGRQAHDCTGQIGYFGLVVFAHEEDNPLSARAGLTATMLPFQIEL